MKVKEFMKINNLRTDEDLRLYFLDNLKNNKLPVAMYSCPKCEEILNDAADIETHICNFDNQKILEERISELSHFIYSNYKCLPTCQCENPTYIGIVMPHICGSCKKLIGHSGMCDCGFCNKDVRDQLINIILKVAMQHHDDISKEDEDAACDAADKILDIIKQKDTLLQWCRDQFNLIKLCHMDCDVPDSEHDMFKLAEEGNKK